MSINELSNSPIDFTFGGRTYKIKTLSLKEFFGDAQAKALQFELEKIKSLASILEGKDKTDYLTNAQKNIPSGDSLFVASMQYLATPLGLAELLKIALNKCQTVSDEEISEALFRSTDEEKALLFSYLQGQIKSVVEGSVDSTNKEDKKK
jgi:hypothetical protein